jgi:hypothetical protein
MNDYVLASVSRKAIVSRMSKAAVIHIVDDDELMRAVLDSLLRSVGLAPGCWNDLPVECPATRSLPDLMRLAITGG